MTVDMKLLSDSAKTIRKALPGMVDEIVFTYEVMDDKPYVEAFVKIKPDVDITDELNEKIINCIGSEEDQRVEAYEFYAYNYIYKENIDRGAEVFSNY